MSSDKKHIFYAIPVVLFLVFFSCAKKILSPTSYEHLNESIVYISQSSTNQELNKQTENHSVIVQVWTKGQGGQTAAIMKNPVAPNELKETKYDTLTYVPSISNPTSTIYFPLRPGDIICDAENKLCALAMSTVMFRGNQRRMLPGLKDLSFTFDYDMIVANDIDWKRVKNLLDVSHLSDDAIQKVILDLVHRVLGEDYWEMRRIYGRP